MPVMPGSRCTEPGCGALTTAGRCDKHARRPWQTVSANGRALSGRQRDRIRARHLRQEPACRACGSTEDLEVDHIIEVADGGALLDPVNLQTLCLPCHREKTAEARRQRAARRHLQCITSRPGAWPA